MWAEDGECGGWLGTFGRSPRSGSRFPSSTFRNGKGKRDEGTVAPSTPDPRNPFPPARRPPEVGGRKGGSAAPAREQPPASPPPPRRPSAEPQPAQSEVLQVLYCANTAARELSSPAPPASPDPHPLPGPGALRLGWRRRASASTALGAAPSLPLPAPAPLSPGPRGGAAGPGGQEARGGRGGPGAERIPSGGRAAPRRAHTRRPSVRCRGPSAQSAGSALLTLT